MNEKTSNHSTESAMQTGLDEASRQDQTTRRKTWQKPILKKLDMRETLLGTNVNPDGGPGYS